MSRILIIVTVLFAVSCQPAKNNNDSEKTNTVKAEITEVTFRVEGMTCTNCEESIAKGVNKLDGIKHVKSSHTDSVTVVKFDKSKSTESDITKQIEKRGYKVKGII
jgi:copper chaperone CopZ